MKRFFCLIPLMAMLSGCSDPKPTEEDKRRWHQEDVLEGELAKTSLVKDLLSRECQETKTKTGFHLHCEVQNNTKYDLDIIFLIFRSGESTAKTFDGFKNCKPGRCTYDEDSSGEYLSVEPWSLTVNPEKTDLMFVLVQMKYEDEQRKLGKIPLVYAGLE